MTLALLRTGVLDQAGNALAAARTAAATSDSSESATSAHCCPVAESNTLADRPDAVWRRSPSIQFGTCRILLIAVAFSAMISSRSVVNVNFQAVARSASRTLSTISSISAWLMINGGENASVSPVVRMMTPLSKQWRNTPIARAVG